MRPGWHLFAFFKDGTEGKSSLTSSGSFGGKHIVGAGDNAQGGPSFPPALHKDPESQSGKGLLAGDSVF